MPPDLPPGVARTLPPGEAADDRLVLGIDGGGTRTTAHLWDAVTEMYLGTGHSGSSNIQPAGVAGACEALDLAIARAFAAAKRPRGPVAVACLGLAGVDREEGLDVIQSWAEQARVARVTAVANDATLLLAAGTPDGVGVAVVCGTGTIAFVRTADGQIGRCGGWGYRLGDEGSGYQIGLAALRHVCRAHDQCAARTRLTDALLKVMGVPDVPALIPAVYRGPWDRVAIAGLAPTVLDTAFSGDPVALTIVRREAEELAETIASAVRQFWGDSEPPPLALSGSLVLRNEPYRELLLAKLEGRGVKFGPMELVGDPAAGAVVEAARLRRDYAARRVAP